MASVPPLLDRPLVKWARSASRHRFRVRPSRAILGAGQLGKVARTLTAILRPSTGSRW